MNTVFCRCSHIRLGAQFDSSETSDCEGTMRMGGISVDLQLFALVQWRGVLGGTLHGQSGHVAQRRQQLQRLGARGRRFHGRGCASWEGQREGGGESL